MIHIFSDYSSADSDVQRRQALARQTWGMQQWTEVPIKDHEVRGMFGFPMVRDLIEKACEDRSPTEMWVLTNSDICIASDGWKRIDERLRQQSCTYAFRRDFNRLDHVVPDHMIGTGYDYCGSDLFAGTVGWWRTHGQLMPELLLGNEAWDAVMRVLMENTKRLPNSLALSNLIYHERHASRWEDPRNRYTHPAQLHNLRVAWKWLVRRKINPGSFGIKMV